MLTYTRISLQNAWWSQEGVLPPSWVQLHDCVHSLSTWYIHCQVGVCLCMCIYVCALSVYNASTFKLALWVSFAHLCVGKESKHVGECDERFIVLQVVDNMISFLLTMMLRRGWWEEDFATSQRFYNRVLGEHGAGMYLSLLLPLSILWLLWKITMIYSSSITNVAIVCLHKSRRNERNQLLFLLIFSLSLCPLYICSFMDIPPPARSS